MQSIKRWDGCWPLVEGFVTGAGVSLICLGSKIDALREQVTVSEQQIVPRAPASSLT